MHLTLNSLRSTQKCEMILSPIHQCKINGSNCVVRQKYTLRSVTTAPFEEETQIPGDPLCCNTHWYVGAFNLGRKRFRNLCEDVHEIVVFVVRDYRKSRNKTWGEVQEMPVEIKWKHTATKLSKIIKRIFKHFLT